MLLIDLSYCVFYRYFATYFWYKKQDGFKEDKSPLEDNNFIEKYDKMFEKMLVGLQKKFEVPWSLVFFAKDCPREQIWRMKHFPAYKQARDEGRLAQFEKNIFVHTIAKLLPKLQDEYKGCHILDIDHLEGDDLIAGFKKLYRQQHPQREIYIIANDNDFLQLLDDWTLVQNLQGMDLKNRMDCKPSEYLERKIIRGDVSDNIPSIAKKVGEKTAEKLAINGEALEALFTKNPEAKTQYELNKLLIAFESVPQNYQAQIAKLYKEMVR
jgi:5'-3' exonuclease